MGVVSQQSHPLVHAHAGRPVAHLMSDGERDRQARILVDVAAAVGLAHPGQMRKAQSLTGLVHSSADVFPGDRSQVKYPYHTLTGQMRACRLPGDENSHVVVSWVGVALGVEVLLPSAETGQSCVSVVNDLQPFLQRRAQSQRGLERFAIVGFLSAVVIEIIQFYLFTVE